MCVEPYHRDGTRLSAVKIQVVVVKFSSDGLAPTVTVEAEDTTPDRLRLSNLAYEHPKRTTAIDAGNVSTRAITNGPVHFKAK